MSETKVTLVSKPLCICVGNVGVNLGYEDVYSGAC